MKNIYIILYVLLLSLRIQCAFDPNQEISLEQCIDEYKESFEKLDKVRPLIECNEHRDMNSFWYSYDCSDDIRKVMDQYFEKDSALDVKLLSSSLGDGFIIGLGSSLMHKMVFGTTMNKESVGITLLAGFLAMFHQMGKIKHVSLRYTRGLEKQERSTIFAPLMRMLMLWGAAGFSFMGGSFVVNKVTGAFNS